MYTQNLLQNQVPDGALKISDRYGTSNRKANGACCKSDEWSCRSDRWERLDTVPESIQSRISVDEIDQMVKEINDEYNSHLLKSYPFWIAGAIALVGFVIMWIGIETDLDGMTSFWIFLVGLVMDLGGPIMFGILLRIDGSKGKAALPVMVRYIEGIDSRYDQINIDIQARVDVYQSGREQTVMDIYIV